MKPCPHCRYQNLPKSVSCALCGKSDLLNRAVAVGLLDIPMPSFGSSREIVVLSTTAPSPPWNKQPAKPVLSLRTTSLLTVATLRSGSQSADAAGAPEESAEPYRKSPGDTPLPGYTLIRPLGRGGFGEVWKCEAPGGLLKAIKFVKGADTGGSGGGHQLRQEYEAFEQVKAIRHPFLLCLERVELIDRELVMVMGLADRHIGERFAECRSKGLPGIPREELIGYLREGAEALDVISAQYGLQHLDVKPPNLFLTAGHLQVGDYGLVSKLDGGTGSGNNRGLTPKYAAPEVLRGVVHTQSDQYSLALVYQEMLTGCFPYSGRSAQQMMMQHVTGEPDLSSLSRSDRIHVAKALAKSPDQRFASCMAFIAALGTADPMPVHRPQGLSTQNRPRPPVGPPVVKSPEGANYLAEIRSVVPLERLLGQDASASECFATTVIDAVLASAVNGPVPTDTTDAIQSADGTWSCRFLTKVSPRLAKFKLDVVWEAGGLKMDARHETRVVFRKMAPSFSLFGKNQHSGMEVVVDLPANGGEIGEVVAKGRVFGSPKPDFVRGAEQTIPDLFAAIRAVLNDVPERRRHPRLPADFAVTLVPIRSDRRLESPIEGRCLDVSAGGLAFQTRLQLPSKYVYAAFEGLPDTRGLALLVQLVRTHTIEDGFIVTGRYRTDL